MVDKNGVEMKTGDVVLISGAFFIAMAMLLIGPVDKI